jgi:hypothetical protein
MAMATTLTTIRMAMPTMDTDISIPMLPDLIISTMASISMATALTLYMTEIVKFMPIIMVSTGNMVIAMAILITNMELKENIVLEKRAVLSLQRS